MRRLGGVCLLALGVLSVLLGAAVAVGFGPDNRLATGPHRLSSDASVITTAPQAIIYAGPRVELTVTRPGGAGKPDSSRGSGVERDLFIGVGHHVDVQDLLGETPRTRIDRIDIPWDLTTSQAGRQGSPRTALGDVDWWYASAEGDGRVVMTWTLPEKGGDVVLADPAGRGGLTVDVTAAVLVPGIFVVGAAMLVIGLGVVVLGWAVLTTRARPRGVHADRPAPAEEDPA